MSQSNFPVSRVAIVGSGNVGATFAYALLFSGLAAEIVLIDVNRARAEGESMDLNHAVPLTHPTKIWAGDYADSAGSAITVIAAGAASRKPGESRLDLLRRNVDVFRDIVPRVARCNPDGILLIATNPVDVLTFASWKLSGLPENRVIGSGTILDTARFRYLLSERFGVDPRSVHAFIIGEHGESEVPVWSLANIAGMKLKEFCDAQNLIYDEPAMEEIFSRTRDAGREIIQRKGATYYAVAAGLLRIVEAILRDQNTVLSVSSRMNGWYGIGDASLSLPTVLGRVGVRSVLHLPLNKKEAKGLRDSAGILRAAIAGLQLEET